MHLDIKLSTESDTSTLPTTTKHSDGAIDMTETAADHVRCVDKSRKNAHRRTHRGGTIQGYYDNISMTVDGSWGLAQQVHSFLFYGH